MAVYSGGCLCGDIRFSAQGAPLRVGLCHCMDCRKHHGAVFHASAIYPVAAVTITGDPKTYAGRSFCRKCGSSVFSQSGDEMELHLGALDAPNQFEPTYELWVKRRENWLPPFPVKRCFNEDNHQNQEDQAKDTDAPSPN
ncbi:GFA family protein [Thalassospira sp. MA62]|nr:GFA family protein [Thalassospira sp. MA62]